MKNHTGEQPKHISRHIAHLLQTWNWQEPLVSSKKHCAELINVNQTTKSRLRQRGIYVKN